MKAVNLRAVESGKSQKDWVVGVLGEATAQRYVAGTNIKVPRGKSPRAVADESTDWMPSESLALGDVVQQPNGALESVVPETAECRRCSGKVARDPKNPKYFKCYVCHRQLDDTEVKWI